MKDTSRLLIARMFASMRERVFRAWTNAKDLHRWWHAGQGFVPSITETDVRIGGRYRLGMISPVTGQEVSTGEFREIAPPERLAMTWRCSEDPDHHEMLVGVNLFDHGKNTELVLTHEGFLSADECEMYSHIWNALFAQLAAYLHESEAPPIELCLVIDAPEEKVFEALTDASQLVRWFPSLVENDPVPGGDFTFKWEYADDPSRNYMRCGTYTEVIPNKTVVHTWDARPSRDHNHKAPLSDQAMPTVVEFRLAPDVSGGTKVMLVHSGWETGPLWDEVRDSHLRGWTFFLSNLKSYLETGADERTKELGMRCAEVIQGVGY